MDKSLWTASCFLLIVGILFLLGGIGCQIYQSYREPFAGRTVARVVELLLQEPEDGNYFLPYKNCYYPVLEYYAEGKLYKVRHSGGSYPSKFRVNQELPLAYDPENPMEYQITENGTMKMVSHALYAAGVASVAVGCIIFLIFARRG